MTTRQLCFFVAALFVFNAYSQESKPKANPSAAPTKKSVPAKKIVTAPAPAAQPPTNELTVEQVIQLVQAGLSDELIMAKIKKNNKATDLSTDELLKLKSAKVSESIILLLLDPAVQSKVASVPTPAPTFAPIPAEPARTAIINPEKTLSDTSSGVGKAHGIYLVENSGKLTKLTNTAFSSGPKMGTLSVIGSTMTFGAHKTKIKATLYGDSAKVRTRNKKPEFLFDFSEDTSPASYVLIRLDKKSGTRETTIGGMRIGGPSMGFDDKKTLKFSAKEVALGKYILKLEGDLAAGEYVFCPANGMLAAGYDFGIDP